jgi:hypothetical protein
MLGVKSAWLAVASVTVESASITGLNRCSAEVVSPVPLAVVGTCSSQPALMLQSRQTTAETPIASMRGKAIIRDCRRILDRVVIAIAKLILSVAAADPCACTCNQSLCVANNVAPPADGRRW